MNVNCKMFFPTKKITYYLAKNLISAALEKSEEMNVNISVAVVDMGGHLISFGRHDNAAFLTIDVAINKAWTASSFKISTHEWNKLIQSPSMIPLVNTERFLPVGGGYPLILNDNIIGAIGVSGGDCDEDQIIAEHTIHLMNLFFEKKQIT